MKLSWLISLAAAATAQTNDARKLRAWFPDGTGLEFETETTGSTSAYSRSGGVVVNNRGIRR